MNPSDTPPLNQAVLPGPPASAVFAAKPAPRFASTNRLQSFLTASQKPLEQPPITMNSPSSVPNVFVVDENASGRSQLAKRVIATGYSALEFVSPLTLISGYALEPGCILMVQRAAGDGYADLLRERRRLEWTAEIIVLAANASVDLAVNAMRLGAFDVWDIDTVTDDDLLKSIELAMAADEAHRQSLHRHTEFMRAMSCLSPREHDVLQLVVSGIPNKLIAKRLGISIRTVEDRRRNIYHKLGVDTAVQLVTLVLEHDPGRFGPRSW